MRQLKQWERHALKFLLGYLVWTTFWLINQGGIYLWIGVWYIDHGFILGTSNFIASAALVMFIVSYLTGALTLFLGEKIFAGFFKPLNQTIKAKREYKRWREGKEREEEKRR